MTTLTTSKYPPSNTDSYTPFNKVCTNTEIEQLISAINIPSQTEFAFRALVACGSGTVPALVQLLQSGDQNIRSKALDSLAKIGTEAGAVIPALVTLLNDPDMTIRAAAFSTLGQLGKAAKAAVPDLIAALKDEENRYNAVYALGELGSEAEAAVPALVPLIRDKNVCSAVFTALGKIGEAAVPDLKIALQDSDDDVRRNAAAALGQMGGAAKAAVPDLIEALKDDKVCDSAINALGGIGSEAEAAIPALVELLKDDNLWQTVAYTLGAIGKAAVPALIAALDSDRRVQIRAVIALEIISQEAKVAATSLSQLLESPDEGLRLGAALALGKIGAAPEAAIPYLITFLKDEDLTIQMEAAQALANSNLEAVKLAIPTLISAIETGEFYESAAEILIKIGEEAIPDLIEALSSEGVTGHSCAAYALGAMGIDAVPALIATLQHIDVNVRHRAAFALGKIGEPAVPALLQALQSDSTDVCKGAAYALGIANTPTHEVMTSLQSRVDNQSNDLDLRRIAASALEYLGADMQSFFLAHDLVAPKNASCPQVDGAKYEFDIFSGKCLLTFKARSYYASGQTIVTGICRKVRRC